MNETEHSQKRFYNHLRMHPGAHEAARTFAQKIVNRDPQAITCLKELAGKAASDEKAANAIRIVAVTIKFEKPAPSGPIFAGGIPAAGGKILKLALSPAAWVVGSGGKLFHWAGAQLQHLSRVI